MDKNLKANIIANIILSKNKDILKMQVPDDVKLEVYKIVGYAKIVNGDVYSGIEILQKCKDMGGEDFLINTAKIGFEKIREKEIKLGMKILKIVEQLTNKVDFNDIANTEDLTDIARLVIKEERLEEGFELLELINKMGGKAYIPLVSDIGYNKISDGNVDIGVKILTKLKELGGEYALSYLGEYIYNKLKAGEIDFALEVLEKIVPIVGKRYFDHAMNIGYQKIAQGDVESGMRIVDGIKRLGGQVDETIYQFIE
ncbi:MAG: hypothetical protein QXG00_04380 [Candidatus Woesearchaeota archaeon]